ncbi:alpha/beta fold hydrolase [Candidatus Microgenomates bacterium]|nr:alpha/beta fold hydrolase [Candidatus Microgenomates bacterium]
MKSKKVTIPGKGYSLSGTLIVPDKYSTKLPAVIFYHGMVSQSKPRYVKRAQALAKEEIATLTFDFRGCGESKGNIKKVSIEQWLADALLAFNFLLEQPFVDPERIGISGKSFGGFIGALVSKERKVKSMVFQAPAVYSDSWFKIPCLVSTYNNEEQTKLRVLYRNSRNAFNNKAIRAIERYRNPFLIIGSEFDDAIPKNIVEGYYNTCPSETKKLVWVKGADHPLRNEKHNQEYTKLMIDWFKETL